MGDITGANSIFTLSVGTIFPAPIQLQGYAADDAFNTDPLESAELSMGVDGILSGGFVFVPVRQTIALQADSPSVALFDGWWAQNQTLRQNFKAQGVIILKAIGTKWALVNGSLTSYTPIPSVHKLLQPRRFGITWESVSPAIP